MAKQGMLFTIFFSMCAFQAAGQDGYESDLFRTSAGDLEITFIGHGSLMLSHNGRTIQVDPWSQAADYARLPKADLVLITHEHGDHLDLSALEKTRKDSTQIVGTQTVAQQLPDVIVLANGETTEVGGLHIEAVAAYNIVHKRDNGDAYHPRGVGNGYVLTFGDTRVYVAGDSENTPEMKAIKDIAVAFLPMNLPYTMTPEMVADAAKAFRPRILYPYHFRGTDPTRLEALLAGETGIEVRIRHLE